MASKGTPKGAKRPRVSKEKIAQARQMLLHTEKSVSQVARELKLCRNTLYYHLGGKRELLERAAARQAEKLAEKAARTSGPRRKPKAAPASVAA